MTGALYWWRATARGSWKPALVLALLGGLLGAVALGAVAGARRTSSAYARYLTSANASDVFVNVPGKLPGLPVTRPVTLISALPGIVSSAAYVGLTGELVVHGRIEVGRVSGSLDGEYFRQDRMTVLAGRLPRQESTSEVVLTPGVARMAGTGVGGKVSYAFQPTGARGQPVGRRFTRTYRVAAIVAVPPVLVDQSDETEEGVLPPGATRQVLAAYGYAWVGLRLAAGTAGIPGLQDHLTALAESMDRQESLRTHQKVSGTSFRVSRLDVIRGQVQQAISPQAVALTVFGGIAALAMLVLVGQAFAQMLSRSARDVSVVRGLGATRAQAALAASLPGAVAVLGGVILAVAGAVAVSPLAPVGPVRQFDPGGGIRADRLVLGAGAASLAVILLGLLAVVAWRAVRQPAGGARDRPSAIARASASAGLPASAVVGTRDALEPGSGLQAVPVRATLLGSVAAVTAVVAAVVFGTSLSGLVSHPARYGWDWDVLIQAEGGYGSFAPGAMNRLIQGQPSVAAWSQFAFTQVPIDGRIMTALGLQRQLGSVQPPTTGGRTIAGDDQIALGAVTLHELGKKIGDSVRVGTGASARTLTIAGTVTLPSFGLATADHVSLGRGAMLSEAALLAVEGGVRGQPGSEAQEALSFPSAVAIDLAPGTTGAQRARLIHRIASADPDGAPGGTYELRRVLAAEVVNASQMGSQPLALALGLAGAAVLSLALTVLTSVRRRRRELALLKALGMTRGQVRAVIAWQTTLTLLIAVAVGGPLGIAAGRWAWRSFAGSLGVVPVTEVPVLVLVLGFAALVVAGNLLTSAPAAVAARTPPAAALRAE